VIDGTATLTEEQRAVREMSARLAAEQYASHARDWDSGAKPFPDAERKRLAELGLLGIVYPAEYGGMEGDLVMALTAQEEVAKVSQAAAFQIFEANVGGARVIHLFGTEEQRRRHLPPIIAGEKTMGVAISEPEAGSAATDLATSARLDGGEYVVNGVKRWCSGAGHAEQYLVYCRLGDDRGAAGIGALVVDRDATGLTFGPRESYMGLGGIASADMMFDDVRVPADDLIIEAGGFKRLFQAFSIERLGNATMSLAVATASLDRAARYVQERSQFGRPIAEFQMVQTALADMIIDVQAARQLIHHAAAAAGTGVPDPLAASVAKCFANEAAKRVSDLAIQVHGGYGYSREYDVERLHRDAHGWAIAGGTPAMQRIRIVSEFLGRRFSQRA
jgi:butyryl-CoA dehydrogenase